MRRRRPWFERVLSSLLVCLLVVPLLPASAAGASEPSPRRPLEFGAAPTRVAGPGSVGTAVAISEAGWKASRYVVVASVRDQRDQLAAAALAGAYGAPLLLTEPTYLPSMVAAEIRRLGASRALVVGSARHVSYRVLRGLARAGIAPASTKRLGSSDPNLTARLVANQIKAKVRRVDSVVLVNGAYPTAALGIAGLAGKYGMPVLYTTRYAVPYQTMRALASLRPGKAILVGSTGLISGGQAWRIRQLTGMAKSRMLRIAASDPYDSAAQIGEFAYANGFAYETVIVANRYIPRDALAAGPWAARLGAPVLLTHPRTLPTATRDFFESHCSSIKTIYAIGASGAISSPVLAGITAAAVSRLSERTEVVSEDAANGLTGVSPDGTTFTFIDHPDLASVEASDVIVSGPTAGAPDGFLRRVTAVNRSSGPLSVFGASTVTLETTEAALEDVIEKGSIDVTGEAPPDVADQGSGFTVQQAAAVDGTHVDVSFASFSNDSFGAPPAAGAPGPMLAPAVPAPRDAFAEAPGAFMPAGGPRVPVARTDGRTVTPYASIGSFSKSFTNVLYERGGQQVRTESSINVDASYVFNASFGIVGWTGGWISLPVYGLKSMKFVTYLSEGATVKLIAELDVAFSKEIELGRYRIATVNFMAGVVPVNIVFYVVPMIGANATFYGKATAGVQQSLSISLGLEYDYRSGWDPIRSSTFGLSLIPPEAEANLSAKAWLGARVEAMFYDSFGPTLQPNAYLQLNADTTKNPWWWLDAGLEAKVGGRVDILGKNKTFSWGPYNLFNRRLANASGTFPSRAPIGPTAMCVAPTVSVAGGETPSVVGASWAAPPVVLDAATVQPGDFAVDGLAVTDALVRPDGKTVRLTTASQVRDRTYNVAVSAGTIKNQAGKGVIASGAGFLAYRPPAVVGASAVDTTTVDVVFDAHAPLKPTTVEVGDFSISGLAATAATLQPDGKTVRLTTAAQSKGTTYTVSVADGAVSDGIFGGEASSAEFPGYWPVMMVGANTVDGTTVDVGFDSLTTLDPATVDASDFQVGGLTVGAAALGPDGRTVRLTTSAQTKGTTYTVTAGAGSLRDAGFANLEGTADFVGYWQPAVASAVAVNAATLDVSFESHKPLEGGTVAPGDFALTPPLPVVDATLQPNGRTVRLITAGQSEGITYTVSVGADSIADTGGWLSAASSADLRSHPYVLHSWWGSAGSGSGQFNSPLGVSLDAAGNVYVADRMNNRVQKFDAEGAWVRSFTGLAQPYDVAVDPTGDVYAIEWNANRLSRLAADGTPLDSVTGFFFPRGVAVDPAGTRVYVADSDNHRVRYYSIGPSSLAYEGQWGVSGSGNGQFSQVAGIDTDDDGNVYTTEWGNDRVQKFTATGGFLGKWGSLGADRLRFDNPLGIDVRPDGVMCVMDQGNARAQRLTGAGEFFDEIPAAGVRGIAIDASTGVAYISDGTNNRMTRWVQPPEIRFARAVDGTHVDLAFVAYPQLDAATVDAADFAVAGLAVSAAAVRPDGRTVRLTTSAQSQGTSYTVSVAAGALSDSTDLLGTGGGIGCRSTTGVFVGYWPVTVASASAVDSSTVDVLTDSYSVLDPASVQPEDFALASPSVPEAAPAVTQATLQPDGRTVRIRTAPNLYPQRSYEVSVGAAAVNDGTFASIASMRTFVATSPAFSMVSVATPFARPATVIRFGDPSQGYITHTWGEIAYTSDGGATWVNRSVPGAPVSNKHVRDIAFVGGDPTKPVAIGWGGMIYTSTNSGTTWTLRTGAAGIHPLPFGTDTNHLWTIDLADANKGYIGGSGMNLFQGTANGGTNWTFHAQSGSIPVDGAWGIDNRWVRFAPGGSRGWYVVGNRIWGTADGGATWAQQYSGAPGYFLCVHAHDAQRAWAVGTSGMIVRTADGGATWQPQASGTTQNLSGVAFTDAYNGFVVGRGSTVLHTWDGGATWTPLTPPQSGDFDSTTFADADTAWVAGYQPPSTPRVFKAVPQW